MPRIVEAGVQTAPHVTTVFEVDMSKVVAHRAAHKDAYARQDADLTYTAYFCEVVTRVLREQATAAREEALPYLRDALPRRSPLTTALVLGLTGITHLVPVFETVDEAMAKLAFQAGRVAHLPGRDLHRVEDVEAAGDEIGEERPHGAAGVLESLPPRMPVHPLVLDLEERNVQLAEQLRGEQLRVLRPVVRAVQPQHVDVVPEVPFDLR